MDGAQSIKWSTLNQTLKAYCGTYCLGYLPQTCSKYSDFVLILGCQGSSDHFVHFWNLQAIS